MFRLQDVILESIILIKGALVNAERIDALCLRSTVV